MVKQRKCTGLFRISAVQKQETAKKQAASGKETSETTSTQKNSIVENGMAKSTEVYAKELAKLAPSVEFKVGNSYSTAKSGKTLTVNPQLLKKMQNNPEQAKETKELIRGVESAMNLIDSINKASGWIVVYKYSYIDENGKYYSVGYYDRLSAGYILRQYHSAYAQAFKSAIIEVDPTWDYGKAVPSDAINGITRESVESQLPKAVIHL